MNELLFKQNFTTKVIDHILNANIYAYRYVGCIILNSDWWTRGKPNPLNLPLCRNLKKIFVHFNFYFPADKVYIV